MANPDKAVYGFAIDEKHPGCFILGFRPTKDKPMADWVSVQMLSDSPDC